MLNKIRSLIQISDFDTVIIGKNDRYFSEYLEPSENVLYQFSGFSGSNAIALFTANCGYLYTDGRYLTQAKKEIDNEYFKICDLNKNDFLDNEYLHKSSQVGIIYKNHSQAFYDKLQQRVDKVSDIEDDLKDLLKSVINIKKQSFIYELSNTNAGETREVKFTKLACELIKYNISCYYFSLPSDIAWLTNLRGDDFPYTPIFKAIAFFLPRTKKLYVFCESSQQFAKVNNVSSNIKFATMANITEFLLLLKKENISVTYDNNLTNIFDIKKFKANSLNIDLQENRLPLIRAKKSLSEIDNIKKAHFNETISLIKLYYYIKNTPLKELSELSVVKRLENYRFLNSDYKGQSFPSIVGFAENGAIIHYRVTKESNKNITKENLLLIDAGAQYPYGTTDATRTLYIGDNPSKEVKTNYTNVLAGHLELAMINFPYGVTGSALDILARKQLWNNHQNYNHGTGHGVGLFLDVHEGPQAISQHYNKFSLEPHMIVSNEPGIYIEDKYGIRIENLQYVSQCSDDCSDDFLEFKQLTFLPYETMLIVPSLLDNNKINFINHYHLQILSMSKDHLQEKEYQWLQKLCQPMTAN